MERSDDTPVTRLRVALALRDNEESLKGISACRASVASRLTAAVWIPKFIYMRGLLLPVMIAALSLCRGARAQIVPARDLLQFPIGTLDHASALPGGINDGFGNPAAIGLERGARLRIGLAALQTPSDQSVDLRMLAVAVAHGERDTFGFSILHAGVGNLYRTTTDPQTVGTIAYNTTLTSLSAAHRFGDHITGGIAARYRTGEIGGDRRGTALVDVGATATHLPLLDARLGIASFLWRPVNPSKERPALNIGGDVRLYEAMLGTAPVDVRGGYGVTLTEGEQREDAIVGAARLDGVQASAGLVRTAAFGSSEWRPRFGIGVRFGGYSASVARQQNGAGLDPIYQFTLSTTIR